MLKKEKYQTPLQMKKIINSYTLYMVASSLLLLQACDNDKKKEVSKSNAEIINEVNTVIGVGKVIPKDGWAVISSSNAGIISHLYVSEGDSIQENQPIMRITDANNTNFDLDEAIVQLSSLPAKKDVQAKNIAKEQIKLNNLLQQYETSKKLHANNAETLEKLKADLNEVQLQQKLIESLVSQQKIDRLDEQAQEIKIQRAKKDIQDLIITASKSGIINEFTAEIGQSITASSVLGKIADSKDVLIEAEVDELFADKVAVGQVVSLYAVGRTDSLGRGKVVYASPTLMNKSILYETVGESEDRRVRRLKIQPDANTNLLINAKVECQIKIK